MSRPDDVRHAIRVGVVFAVSLVLLAGGIWVLGSESRVWSRKIEYRTAFRNVQGLSDGTTITLAGYRIGKVTDIRLPDDVSRGLVDVVISVEKKNSRYIRRDTKARIKTIGILGDKYIELSPGSPAEPELKEGDTIEAIQPPNLEGLMAQGASVADNLVVLSSKLANIVDKVDRGQGLLGALISDTPEGVQITQEIKDIISRMVSVTEKVDQGDGLAASLLNDAKPAADLKSAMASLARVARDLERGEGLAGRLISDPELARDITANLKDASRHLNEVTRKLDVGDGLVGRLVNDRELADDVARNVRQATASLAGITRRVEGGEGTIGKLLVDETLYEGLNDILAGARRSRLTRWFIARSQKAAEQGRKDAAAVPPAGGAAEGTTPGAGTGGASAAPGASPATRSGKPGATPKPKKTPQPAKQGKPVATTPSPTPTATPVRRGAPVVTPVAPRGPLEEPTASTPAPEGATGSGSAPPSPAPPR